MTMNTQRARHSASPEGPWVQRTKRYASHIAIGVMALLVGFGGAAWATPTRQNVVVLSPTMGDCQLTQGATADTWISTCKITGLVAPGPSATPTASPTASPSSSPTTSPTVTPTTPPPTTTAPPTTTPPATTPPATTPPVTTPPPTTPPAGTLLANCWTQLAACGYPTQANTGVPPSAVLTAFNGNLVIRSGGTWQNIDVKGCIDVQTTQAVVLRNIRVTPANPAQGCGQGNIHKESAGQLLIEDVTSYCTQAHGHGFWVRGTTARRVQTYGCENGFELNDNSAVVDSWIAGSEFTTTGGDPHGDDIQSQGGNNVLVQHNTFAGVHPKTSSIITNPTQNNNWVIENNFLSSGSYTLYCPENGTGFVVRNNRFSGPVHTAAERANHTGDPHDPAYGYTDACNHSGIQWGVGGRNYRDDNPALTVGASS